MRKLSFWHRTEYGQIEAIAENAENLDLLQSNTELMQQRVEALRRQVNTRRSEIGELRAALQAVCDLLVDLGVIDDEALGYRIEAAVAEAAGTSATTSATTSAPSFTSSAPAPAAVESEATCARCRLVVPARDISFTDLGPICKACVDALAAESE